MRDDFSRQRDEEIVELIQSGKIELFGILIERYESKIERYSRKFLSDQDDIKDVLQDIFIKAYRNIRSFDIDRKFSSWLYRIAHNEFVNVLKKKNKKIISIFDFDAFFPQRIPDKDDISRMMDQKDMKETVDKFLNKLELKYREPVILFYLEDLSYREIADIMHIPVTTVGIRIKRARDMMKSISKELKYDL